MTIKRHRIDLHHHAFAPELVAALERQGIEYTGGTGVPPWSLAATLETMEQYDIAAAIMSVHPQPYWPALGDAPRWASSCNDVLARIVDGDRQRFGALASLPLPDTGAACRELARAFDELHFDGVQLMTSVDGRYLGDPEFEELFQELDKRSAVVVLHPTMTPPGTDARKLPLPDSLVEFVFDSTRTVASLLYSGRLARYPNIRYVVPHAGGAVPFLAPRIAMGEEFHDSLRARVPLGSLHYLRKLYYDVAVATAPTVLATLRQFVPATQIVYGSDFPYVRQRLLERLTRELDTSALFDEAERAAIDRGNAAGLFPRFAAVAEAV